MKKVLLTIVVLFGVSTLGACTSSGITHLGEGKVAVSINSYFGNKDPILYDCSSGSLCVRIGK